MNALQQIALPVAQQFDQFRALLRSSIISNHPMLRPLTQYVIEPRGKTMRPLLGLLVARLHSPTVDERTQAVVLLFELLHHATLIHDDVIDEAYTRRGELTVGAMLRSRAGVLVGDFLFAKGLMQAAKAGAFAEIEVATHAIELVVEGELRQSENTRKLMVDSNEYFDVVRLKTGALISGISLCAAISVGATSQQCDDMRLLGDHLGVAFQIRDDILDYVGSSSKTGKALFNDVKERKITLPLILAMANTGQQRKVRSQIRAGKVQWIVDFVADAQGVQAANEVMMQYHNKAMSILAQYPDSEVKTALELFTTYATNREK